MHTGALTYTPNYHACMLAVSPCGARRCSPPSPFASYIHTYTHLHPHPPQLSHRAECAALLGGAARCSRGAAALRKPRTGSAGTKPASAPPLASMGARPVASPTVTSTKSPTAAPTVLENMLPPMSKVLLQGSRFSHVRLGDTSATGLKPGDPLLPAPPPPCLRARRRCKCPAVYSGRLEGRCLRSR